MWQAIISGLTLGLILALSVGPVIFTIIKQSLNHGYTGGFSFVTGVWLSDIILVVLCNTFSEIIHNLLRFEKMIGIVGSIFLVAMGVIYIFFKKVTLQTNTTGEITRFRKRDMLKIFSSGFFINTLNPNVFIFWLGTSTAFAAKFTLLERTIIFSVCIGLNILADVVKVVMSGRLRKRLTLHNISLINKISGSILIVFGLVLLYGVVFLSQKIQRP